MKFVWDSAFSLLIVAGGLLGVSLPLGRIATAAGVSGMVWAFVISFGAGSILLCTWLLKGHRIRLTRHKLRYFILVAIVSYAFPNLLLFSALPHLGAGYAGIMFTLSPIITLVFSILLGVRRPNMLGVTGIVIGFIGAVVVATTRGEAGHPAALFWVAMGLLVPVSLAVGNIYRTWDWPGDTGPIELAIGSHLASAAMLFAGILAFQGGDSLRLLGEVPLVVAVQVVSAAALFAFFFRLQAVGGPVYLSQMGYVAAAVGLFSGTLFLGEQYQGLTWAGAVIICGGVFITTKAQGQKE
jgi:drug/metabolite transporter (DMT)-like permease